MSVQPENSQDLINLFIPRTAEQRFQAVKEVSRYLDDEDERLFDKQTRNKRAKTDSQKDPPFPINLYMSCGILPWYIKNKAGHPANDDQCDVRVPDCIKNRILQYRKWYPTVLDKLYCFDNHSPYLSDMKLFGCWECIRKHYNEFFTWGKKVGLLKI